jgi:predicted nucleic acid-binding protein
LALARAALPGSLLLVSLDELFDPAVRIAIETSQSFYDALYIATAELWNTVLVTADERLVEALQRTVWRKRVRALGEWAT